jgi:catechol 2,3-dioxygenase-like lactoylglutathione lyase family enzyme
MEAKYHSVALFVHGIECSKNFYNRIMQIGIEMDMGINVVLKNGITLWQVDPNHIIPQSVGYAKIVNKGFGFELYFETEDLDAAVETIRSAGQPFVHKIHEEPWGQRTVRIYDPDKNIVEIGESMKCFLSRMMDGGMSLEQGARKTGMKEKDIRRTTIG